MSSVSRQELLANSLRRRWVARFGVQNVHLLRISWFLSGKFDDPTFDQKFASRTLSKAAIGPNDKGSDWVMESIRVTQVKIRQDQTIRCALTENFLGFARSLRNAIWNISFIAQWWNVKCAKASRRLRHPHRTLGLANGSCIMIYWVYTECILSVYWVYIRHVYTAQSVWSTLEAAVLFGGVCIKLLALKSHGFMQRIYTIRPRIKSRLIFVLRSKECTFQSACKQSLILHIRYWFFNLFQFLLNDESRCFWAHWAHFSAVLIDEQVLIKQLTQFGISIQTLVPSDHPINHR